MQKIGAIMKQRHSPGGIKRKVTEVLDKIRGFSLRKALLQEKFKEGEIQATYKIKRKLSLWQTD